MGNNLVKSSWQSGILVFEQKATAGAIHFGIDDTGLDVKFFGATSGSYLLWDESADKLIFDGADFRLQDSDILSFGDADDVSVTWNASNLAIVPVANDTGAIQIGNGTLNMDLKLFGASSNYVQWDQSDYALEFSGTSVSMTMGTSASVVGSATALSSTKTAVARFYGDDGNAAITSDVFARVGVFRNLLTYTGGNREQEAAGVVGQVVSVAGTNRHNMCGVMGSYEASTSLVVDGQAWGTDPWIQAGVVGRVGVGSGITTINANGILAGVAAMSNTASFSGNSGYYTAYYAGAWASASDWAYGITFDSASVDVAICVPGGASSDTGTAGTVLQVGTLSAPLQLNTAGQFGIKTFFQSSATTGDLTGARVRAMGNAASGTPGVIGVLAQASSVATKYVGQVAALRAETIFKASTTVGATEDGAVAGYFKVEDDPATSGSGTSPTYSGRVGVLNVFGQISADPTGGYYGIVFDCQSATGGTGVQAWDSLLHIVEYGGQNQNIVALLSSAATLAQHGASSAMIISSGTLTASGSITDSDVKCDARIKVNIGGTAHWIPLYNTAP